MYNLWSNINYWLINRKNQKILLRLAAKSFMFFLLFILGKFFIENFIENDSNNKFTQIFIEGIINNFDLIFVYQILYIFSLITFLLFGLLITLYYYAKNIKFE